MEIEGDAAIELTVDSDDHFVRAGRGSIDDDLFHDGVGIVELREGSIDEGGQMFESDGSKIEQVG